MNEEMDLVEKRIETFQKIKYLGKGTLGETYLIKSKNKNEYFIAKIYEENKARELNVNYFKSLSSVNHPNVARYIKLMNEKNNFQNKHNICIIREYCKGFSLLEKINSVKESCNNFEETYIIQIFLASVNALFYLYSHNILHENLKPSNIFIEEEQNLKIQISDYGINELFHPKNQNIFQDYERKKFGYNNSEEFIQKEKNNQSDIWSLGCILYEMCTFHLPNSFPINDNNKYNENKLLKQNIELSEINPKYSFRLRNLIIKMLDNDKLERPTITELISALDYLPFLKNPVIELSNLNLIKIDKNLDDNYGQIIKELLSNNNYNNNNRNNKPITNSLINKSINLNIEGIKLYQNSNFVESLSIYEELLLLRIIYYGEISPEVAEVYNNLSLLYFSINEASKSEMCHKKSVTIWKILNDVKESPVPKKYNNEKGKNIDPTTTEKISNTNNINNLLLNNKSSFKIDHSFDRLDFVKTLDNEEFFQNEKPNKKEEFKNSISGDSTSSKYTQLRLFEQSNIEYKLIESKNLENLGDYYYNNGDFKESCFYYKQAFQINAHLFGYSNKVAANIYIKIGKAYFKSGDKYLGNSYIKKAVTIFHEKKLYDEEELTTKLFLNE